MLPLPVAGQRWWACSHPYSGKRPVRPPSLSLPEPRRWSFLWQQATNNPWVPCLLQAQISTRITAFLPPQVPAWLCVKEKTILLFDQVAKDTAFWRQAPSSFLICKMGTIRLHSSLDVIGLNELLCAKDFELCLAYSKCYVSRLLSFCSCHCCC